MNDSPSDETVRSPLSDAESCRFICKVKDHAVSGEWFSLYEDDAYKCLFTHPQPKAGQMAKYYASDEYLSHNKTNSGLFAKLFYMAQLYTIRRKYRLLKTQLPSPKNKLLDFGCGTGEFAGFVKSKKWDVTCTEPSEKAASYARKEHHLDVYEDLETLPQEKTFDAITAWHVLEHVHEPGKTLEKLRALLNDDGCLILALPNYKSTDARFYKEMWAGLDVPRHLYHFSPESVQILSETHGFEIIRVKRMMLDAFYVSLLSEQYFKTGFAGIPGALAFGLWSNITALISKNRCSSLIYILKKRS